nr:Gag-Pol polyprotein [Tanacetum cinerariifolium]
MFKDVTQNTYAYAEVHAQNQDLLMTISELKSKLKMINNRKHVNNKFDISETLRQLLCVTSFNKTLTIKTKNVSNTKATSDSGCSKHMNGNLQLLRNFVEKFIGTVHFGNDHFTAITGYGDYVQACEQGKSKKASLSPKLVPSTESKLELLYMDLCGPMRVTSNNGKKYILVIVDDYSQFTWLYFLHTKDEDPYMIIDFVNQVQRNLKVLILRIQTDNGIEFKNEKLRSFYAKLSNVYKTSIARTAQQNGIVERRKQTLVEIKPKADICIFVGYSVSSRGFHIYNRQSKKIMETIHVKFDEHTAMASECDNLKPEMNCMNFNDSSEDSQCVPSTSDLDNLFGPMSHPQTRPERNTYPRA